MKRISLSTAIILTLFFIAAAPISVAEELSIYEIQYTTDAAGDSPWNNQLIDCQGGIVTSTSKKFRAKVTIYDPNHPNGWGAVLVKDLDMTGLLDDVNEGDWISLSNFFVEESYGNTTLQVIAGNNPSITIHSRNNPLPEPLALTVDQIAAPVEIPFDGWYVADHNSEPYEAMLVKIADIAVQSLGTGSHNDNYVLEYAPDPNLICWVADYANADVNDLYHDSVTQDQHFCSVTGIIEQYTKLEDGWDYYQVLTRRTEDMNVIQAGDLDDDCDVDLEDFAVFAINWLATEADRSDLEEISLYWLQGKE